MFNNLWKYHDNKYNNVFFKDFKIEGVMKKIDNSLFKQSERWFEIDFKDHYFLVIKNKWRGLDGM